MIAENSQGKSHQLRTRSDECGPGSADQLQLALHKRHRTAKLLSNLGISIRLQLHRSDPTKFVIG
jgi:hypothetical protein